MKTTKITTTRTQTGTNNGANNAKRRRNRPRSTRISQVMSRVVNTTTPVAYGSTVRNSKGAQVMSSGNVTRVSHREFIADISASTSNFAATVVAVNPGNVSCFPWLNAIASNYETYTFKRLAFRYVPLCPTSTQGRITMALDYDARDATPTTKAVLSQYQGAIATPVWQQGLYVADVANLTKAYKQRYVSGATIPTNADVKTYHLGSFILASSNTPATATQLGELWVEYDVELQTPQIATQPISSQNNEKITVIGGAQRTTIGIRNQFPVLDTSFSGLIHHVLGKTWEYPEGGSIYRKFSLLLNKYLNHPVLYLIKYASTDAGYIKLVRPQDVNTSLFAPSVRWTSHGGALPVGDFPAVDLTPSQGIGVSDPVNDGTIGRRFLAFIAFPQPTNPDYTADFKNAGSQLQFQYLASSGNSNAVVDIQSFSLPQMSNNDTNNNVFASMPTSGGNYSTTNEVELAGWQSLNNYVALSSGTLRQVTNEDGSVRFVKKSKVADQTGEDEEVPNDDEQLVELLKGILSRSHRGLEKIKEVNESS